MNFGQDFYERMKVARSTAAKHGLVLQPLSPEAHKEKETQPKEDAEPEKHHGGFFDGRYVFSLRGSESYIARAAQWRELPPELFVLLGETGFNKVRLQKEVAVKEGKSVMCVCLLLSWGFQAQTIFVSHQNSQVSSTAYC